MPLDRILCGFDESRPVAVAASWPFVMTVPGGELPCGGVTWVGVLPTHRRRGLARELMRLLTDDAHRRGEPLAALWATESQLYARYGYGIATLTGQIEADRATFALRDDPGPEGALRLLTREEALELLPPVYDRVRPTRNGFVARSADWWDAQALSTHWESSGDGTRFHVLLELDGRPEGYAIYRIKSNWGQGFPANEVRVAEVVGTSPRAVRELWRFLFSIDLTATVGTRYFDSAAPLFHAVVEPRRLRPGYRDGIWLRLVDADAALRARSWAGDDALVAEVRDDFCPRNAGRYRLGSDAGRTEDEPDLALDVADLASLYLGGVDPAALHGAGRIEERTAGAVERAAALLRTPLPPFCPEVF
jgi:predicted acetyltransferase